MILIAKLDRLIFHRDDYYVFNASVYSKPSAAWRMDGQTVIYQGEAPPPLNKELIMRGRESYHRRYGKQLVLESFEQKRVPVANYGSSMAYQIQQLVEEKVEQPNA